jgi:hypothetical protein
MHIMSGQDRRGGRLRDDQPATQSDNPGGAADTGEGLPAEYEGLTVGGLCGWLRADHSPMGTLRGAGGALWCRSGKVHRGSLVVGLAWMSARGSVIPSSAPDHLAALR